VKKVAPKKQPAKAATKTDPLAFTSAKAKVAQKDSAKEQWEIMRSMDVADKDLEHFADPHYWLGYFPPLAMQDVSKLGCKVDWRRSMVTTPVNPFYDSFVRWQFLKLKEKDLVRFGKRFTIWSPADNQSCMGHDRSVGENVAVQEYTLIKLEVAEPYPEVLSSLAKEGRKVYFAAATLRPETMYGQTNCWVLPDGKYGAFEINDTEVFIVSHRAGRNLAFQENSREWGKEKCLLDVTGQQLIGTLLRAPLREGEESLIYTLPMLTIDMEKGTAVVTCVPSDAPADWRTLQDLRDDEKQQAKYNVKKEWIPEDLIEIIDVPEYGTRTAEKLCNDMKIKDQHDEHKLNEAKDICYKHGFNFGTMLVGEFKGMAVKDAKPLVLQKLLDNNQAVKYAEPNGRVVSRSGDEGVAALVDQWFIPYGEPEWRALCDKALENMRCYGNDTETYNEFVAALNWLNNAWPCSRTYGLGTSFPWAPEFLVCSLSDSTLYMAYYTVAHLLHEGSLDGSTRGKANVSAQQMTPAVWDYIFCLSDDVPTDCDIAKESLELMRREFSYWYPCDCRVSGKDLIKNHLTFSLYNHTAIFPEKHWPKGVRCNGFLNLNGEKMAKSTGNFITLADAITKYSSDVTRLTLAISGDSLKVADFTDLNAFSSIDRLRKLIDVITEQSHHKVTGTETQTYADKVFLNEIAKAMNTGAKNYENANFRKVFSSGATRLWSAFDRYLLSSPEDSRNGGLLRTWCESLLILYSPVCCYTTYHLWKNVLGNETPIYDAKWPSFAEVDVSLLLATKWTDELLGLVRHKLTLDLKGKLTSDVSKVKIFLSREHPEDVVVVFRTLLEVYKKHDNVMPDLGVINKALCQQKMFSGKAGKKKLGLHMKTIKGVSERVLEEGESALSLDPQFDEAETLSSQLVYFQNALDVAGKLFICVCFYYCFRTPHRRRHETGH